MITQQRSHAHAHLPDASSWQPTRQHLLALQRRLGITNPRNVPRGSHQLFGRDIDRLDTRIKIVNIVLVPAAVMVVALVYAVRRKRLDTIDVDDAPAVADEDLTPASVDHDRGVLKEALTAALGKLSTDHRDVVELTFFHGLSYQEIAEVVGCPENTVKTRMFHARKQLKGLLAAAGLDPDSVEMAS